MSDRTFLDDLERDLVAAHPRRGAARRRAAAGAVARRVPAVLAVVAVVGLGAALVGVLDGGGGGDGDGRQPAVPAGQGAPPAASPPVGGTRLDGLRVAVLNGTTRKGLARRVSDRLVAAGASVRVTTTDVRQDVAETIVMAPPSHRDAATAVARRLGGARVQEPDAARRMLAGRDAPIIVVAGEDLDAVVPPLPPTHAEVGCGFGAEETAPTVDRARGDVALGDLAVLGARATIGRRRDAFGNHGYKLAVTVADGSQVMLAVPPGMTGKVGLVYRASAQERVWREGVGAADRTVRFTACRPGGKSPRTGWPGGLVVDRPRCAVLSVQHRDGRVGRLRVPLGRRC